MDNSYTDRLLKKMEMAHQEVCENTNKSIGLNINPNLTIDLFSQIFSGIHLVKKLNYCITL